MAEELKVHQVERSEDVKEEIGTRSTLAIVPGAICLILGILFVGPYRGGLVGLGWVLLAGGLVAVGWGVWQLIQSRKVSEYKLQCPFCFAVNVFTEKPDDDVRCSDCQRLVPIEHGVVLRVFQVRCGYCQHLNYYSEKSTTLICEQCDSLIPIATDEEPEAKVVLERFTTKDDRAPYDLVLLAGDAKSEKLVGALQQMLALNRNQIKRIMEQTPAVLYTGIPKRKAEMLLREIEEAGGRAEYKLSEEESSAR